MGGETAEQPYVGIIREDTGLTGRKRAQEESGTRNKTLRCSKALSAFTEGKTQDFTKKASERQVQITK